MVLLFLTVQVFCICFLHVDATWTQRNAVRTDFGKIIGAYYFLACYRLLTNHVIIGLYVLWFHRSGELKSSLQNVLARGPRSLEDFKHIAAAEGMNILI